MEFRPTEEPTLRQLDQQENQFRQGQPTHLGKYFLVRLLAEGGFASVYLGEHIHLKTLAAVKVLHTHLGQQDWEEFRKEARLVASLRHPHIIRIHDFESEPPVPFLIMDYAPYGTLRQRHPRGSQLPLETILHYLQQIGPALQYAHDRRLIHRDIKPENLLVGEDGSILLSDFGIALVLSTMTQSQREIVGTLAYMAPEQWQGKPVQASDQYALGVVVYEWLVGHCPFQGGPAELAAQHVHQPPPSLCTQRDLTSMLEAVVLRALAKQPQERFSAIMDFVQAFATALQAEPLSLPAPEQEAPEHLLNLHQDATIQDLPPDPVQTQPTRAKQKTTRRAVLAGATGLLAIGVSLSWLLIHKPWIAPQRANSTPTPPTSTPTPAPTPIAIGTTLHTYRGHHDSVNGLAASPDGSQIVSVSTDTTIQVWDTSTGGVQAVTYSGHTAAVNAVAWSADGSLIVSGSDDGSARVWKISDGSNSVTYTGHGGAVKAVAWSSDNTTVASGSSDKTVQVWSAADGSTTFTYSAHTDEVRSVAWSPDNTRIASASADGTVQIWNASDGSNPFTYTGHSGPVNAVAWSPDGTMLASGSSDKTVRVWQAISGTLVFVYGGHADVVSALAWSPDSTRIASASADKTVQIWGANDGSNPFTYSGHSAPVHTLAWLPDTETEIASGGEDTLVQIWQAS